jgi:hypothetical protein
MAMPMMDMGGDMGAELEDEDAPEEPADDFTAAITEAFPDLGGDPARVAALKTAIELCVNKDLAGEYDDEGAGEKPGGLALVFGAEGKPKKK